MEKNILEFEKIRYDINNCCCIGKATLEKDENNQICRNSLDELMEEEAKEKDREND